MKVKELEVGMLLRPAGDNEMFLKVAPFFDPQADEEISYITVRIKPRLRSWMKRPVYHSMVMYLGTKNDLKISRQSIDWSNRFVMLGTEICAVDPTSWRRMVPVYD